MKTGDVVLYKVPEEMKEYFRPDDSGCIAAIVAGVHDGMANVWLLPNTPNVPPMLKMKEIAVPAAASGAAQEALSEGGKKKR